MPGSDRNCCPVLVLVRGKGVATSPTPRREPSAYTKRGISSCSGRAPSPNPGPPSLLSILGSWPLPARPSPRMGAPSPRAPTLGTSRFAAQHPRPTVLRCGGCLAANAPSSPGSPLHSLVGTPLAGLTAPPARPAQWRRPSVGSPSPPLPALPPSTGSGIPRDSVAPPGSAPSSWVTAPGANGPTPVPPPPPSRVVLSRPPGASPAPSGPGPVLTWPSREGDSNACSCETVPMVF